MSENSTNPRLQDHKDKTVLYYALGKAIFDEKFRQRLFEDPERAASSTGLDSCVIESLAKIGPRGLDDFVNKFEKALANAALNASFC